MTSTIGQRADRSAGIRARDHGFTLIELILVMVVICAVLGIAAPSLRGFFISHQATDAARQMISLMQLARTQSISEGRNYRLNFDTQARTYWLTVQDGAAYAKLNSEFGQTFTLPEGSVFDLKADPADTSTDHMDFYPSGATSGLTIKLTGRQGDAVEISQPALAEPFQIASVTQGQGS